MRLTAKELAEITYKDLENRKEQKRKGQFDAECYVFDMQLKSFKKKSRIRCKSYRG